ncbi:LacI family DNA-binding transcriptional regulator [Microbacterium sp. A84]|uniref:LacI family DNA-binding transcriptional regulator n=1 Tax=Microbacterium sp. A84 TaxID=3450715 RepID=UPI003F428CF4
MNGPTNPTHGHRVATIYDVATLAGVSHITVSRYLNGTAGVKASTGERIASAIIELGYRPNLVARSLVTSRSRQIAAIVHEISGMGLGLLVEGAYQLAASEGYAMTIMIADPLSEESMADALARAAMLHVEGVITTAPTDIAETSMRSFTSGPLVVARGLEDCDTHAVGIRAAVEHLIRLGHRRIVHLAGPSGWLAARDRKAQYEQTMHHHDLEPVTVARGNWLPVSGFGAVDEVIASGATAVVSANDRMAFGLIKALSDRGIDVPGRISVTGYDDHADTAYSRPALTTCRQDFAALGRHAAARLIGLIEGRSLVQEGTGPLPELVVRASTARAKDIDGAVSES